ncbi:MAG: lamin tail domain-containing protein, partial [bacterium]|nr:lamin tail domain-containing protein [bacterium]
MKGRILKYLILVILAGTVRVGFSAAVFSDQAVLSDNEVSAGCWAKPTTPTLVSPADGYMAVPGSGWLANPVMDWTDSYTTCPSGVIQYRYESYHDAGLTSLAYHSSLLSASQIPAPGTSDGDYYWRVAAFDGTTWSDWSEVWKLTVDRSYQTVGAGDVVINEVMWMGSAPVEEDSNRSDDEWIELRNMTDYEIDIGQWEIENARSSGQPSLMIPASKAIAANGYFLIANYSENSANSALNVSVDEVNASISLANSGNGHLVLKDAAGNTIDEAKGNTWPAGESGTQKKSMERNGVPGDGLDAGSWHTCTDAVCNDGTYWDVEGDNYGTPGGENHSENDPTAVGEKQAGEALETAQATVEPFIEDGQAGGESGGATEEGS